MSVNYNRAITKDIATNRDYTLIQKNHKVYCMICVRRTGNFKAFCGAYNDSKYRRAYRTWKHTRKKQYKCSEH